jgi:hypothetical protein
MICHVTSQGAYLIFKSQAAGRNEEIQFHHFSRGGKHQVWVKEIDHDVFGWKPFLQHEEQESLGFVEPGKIGSLPVIFWKYFLKEREQINTRKSLIKQRSATQSTDLLRWNFCQVCDMTQVQLICGPFQKISAILSVVPESPWVGVESRKYFSMQKHDGELTSTDANDTLERELAGLLRENHHTYSEGNMHHDS